jgi:hypothetical protein
VTGLGVRLAHFGLPAILVSAFVRNGLRKNHADRHKETASQARAQ